MDALALQRVVCVDVPMSVGELWRSQRWLPEGTANSTNGGNGNGAGSRAGTGRGIGGNRNGKRALLWSYVPI
eukprot:4691467-Prymnesium_polylepis.1